MPYSVRLFNPVLFSTVGGAQKYTATIAQYLVDTYRDLDLSFIAYGPFDGDNKEAIRLLNERYGLTLPENLGVRMLEKGGKGAIRKLQAQGKLRDTSKGINLFINCFHNVHYFYGRRNIHLVHFPARPRTEASPFFLRHPLLKPVAALLDKRYRDGYELFICNSRFTESWLERYWRIEPERRTVLYPPVASERTQDLDFGRKGKTILLVSRFDPRKNLREAVRFFAEREDRFAGWKLVAAGGVSEGERGYLREIEDIARDHRVDLVANPSRAELEGLYSEASVFWHAMGLEVNELANPLDLEHFGITTVEAMAAGAVPIVIDKGGQREIVNHGINGFRWKTFDQLESATKSVIEDEALRRRLAKKAFQNSNLYSMETFHSHIDGLFIDKNLIPKEFRR